MVEGKVGQDNHRPTPGPRSPVESTPLASSRRPPVETVPGGKAPKASRLICHSTLGHDLAVRHDVIDPLRNIGPRLDLLAHGAGGRVIQVGRSCSCPLNRGGLREPLVRAVIGQTNAPGPLGDAGSHIEGGDRELTQFGSAASGAGGDTGQVAVTVVAVFWIGETIHCAGDRTHRMGKGRTGRRIGDYLEKSLDARAPSGFIGGTFGDEPTPVTNTWKSTEHNTDLAAAFSQLADATGETSWKGSAHKARNFVDAMWVPTCGCFAVGTAADGQTINPFLALDAQVLPLLAVPGEAAKLGQVTDILEKRLKDGGGFSYSEVKEGIWTEGTAQAALLFELTGNKRTAHDLQTTIQKSHAPRGSYYAANLSQIPTGFMLQTDPTQPLSYFHLSHLAALSWTALAQQRVNPFTGTHELPTDP
jgi:hypothetical protein